MNTIKEQPMAVAAPRFVTTKMASQLLGLTVKAIDSKIARGVWQQGKHYRKRDGNNFIDLREIEQWVAKEPA